MSIRQTDDADSREAVRGEDADTDGVVLEITDLHGGYGEVPVLRGVSLQLHEGEAIGIVGHNGMGKTTLLRTIMGLLPSTGGKIVVDGVDVTTWAAHERSRLGIAYVPQGRGILPGLSAHENLRLAWTPDSGETEERAIERVVGIFPRLNRLLNRRGGALSGGEQQILALARALVSLPWLLVLDEPSEGIQPSIVQEIGELLAALREKHRLSMLIVEQNLELVLDVAQSHRAGRARPHYPRTRLQCSARRRHCRSGRSRQFAAGAAAGHGESPAYERSAAPRFAKQRRGPAAGERRAGAGFGGERTTRRAIAKIRACRAGQRHIIRGSHVHRQTAHARTDARHRRFIALEHVARRSRRIPGGAGRHLPGLRSGQ